MNTALWIAQVAVGLIFALGGAMKISRDKEQLRSSLPWVEEVTVPRLRVIGALELLGGAALVLPRALDLIPTLGVVAAVALALMMVLAARLHWRRRELGSMVLNAALLTALVFIAAGRA